MIHSGTFQPKESYLASFNRNLLRFAFEGPAFGDENFRDESDFFAVEVFHQVHVVVDELRYVDHLQFVVLVELEKLLIIQNFEIIGRMKGLLRDPLLFP